MLVREVSEERPRHALGQGGREKKRVKRKRKRAAQGPTLSHTAGQEVLDGDTLPVSAMITNTGHHSVSHHMRHETSIMVEYFVQFIWSCILGCVLPIVTYLLHRFQDSGST